MNDVSLAQKNFLLSQRKRRRIIRISRICIFLLFLILWEGSAQMGTLDSFIFSSPSKAASCAYGMIQDHSLFVHIGITLFETITSFGLILVILNSLPKSALAPLLIVWLGANYTTIIITGMSVAIFGSILSLYTCFQSVDAEKVKLIYTLGGQKHHVLAKVILPASIPSLFALMKVNIGLCLVGVIIGEFIASRQGLGYLIIYGSQVFTWVYKQI